MKKLFLILTTTIFLSCSNDDEKTKCNCNAWVREDGNIREVIPVEFDCETGQPLNLPNGYIFLGCDNDNIP